MSRIGRREFVTSLAAAGLATPALAGAADGAPACGDGLAVTVTGLIDRDALGITLPHEHLLIDFSCRYLPAPDEPQLAAQPRLEDRWRLLARPAGYRVNLDGTSIESAIKECGYYRAAGGRTIVDLTGLGLGPDPRGLERIARATGLNVIASTGYYIDSALPDWVRTATVEQLASRLIDDLETGARKESDAARSARSRSRARRSSSVAASRRQRGHKPAPVRRAFCT